MSWKEHPIADCVGKCQTWNPRAVGTGSFDYIDLSSVDKDTKSIVLTERYECSDAPSRARQLVETDDVLVATVRPNLNGVALVNGARHGMTASTGYCVLRPDKYKIDPRFLFHWVKTGVFVERMVDVATGANYPAVSDAKVKASRIPLPPLTEQTRIAEILDAADALRIKRRDALAQLDTLLQSVFLDMFGDPVANPKRWETRELSETKSKVQIGPFGSLLHKADYIADGVPVINPMHIVSGQIRPGHEQTVPEQKAATLCNYRLQAGDVVMGRRGEMGRCAIVSEAEAGMLCGTGSLFFRPDPDELSSLFLATTFSSEPMKRRLEGLSQGVTMPNLNRSMIEGLKVGLPPLSLQHAFRAIVESIERQRTRQLEHLAELDGLFSSLQSRAFRGDL